MVEPPTSTPRPTPPGDPAPVPPDGGPGSAWRRPRFGRGAAAAAGGLALVAGLGAGALVCGATGAPDARGPQVAGPVAAGTPSPADVPAEEADVPVDDDAEPAEGRVTALPEPPEAPGPADLPDPVPEEELLDDADRAAGLLSREMPQQGTGELVTVAGEEPAPLADRRVMRIRVEVEAGLDIDGPTFARLVMEVLNDPRGWSSGLPVTFARTDGEADGRVVLASPAKVDEMCAPLETVSLYSCGRNGHAALNHMRWVQGTPEFPDLAEYRRYLVNHEVGHLLGQPHVPCPEPGVLAPVMQQQTIEVAPCRPNGWPFPDAG